MAEQSAPDKMITSMMLADKAGMGGLDKEKINQIIQEASKGSKFYQHKKARQEKIDQKIKQLKQDAEKLTKQQIEEATGQIDAIAARMEADRDLSRTIVHIDMDAYFAAVEMRDNPELRDVPMAVGGSSMLSTSNYAARRYGVRAAMPGFIAKKLCPSLIIVPPNFDKYTAVSKDVRAVFAQYDPHFSTMSLDEAYMDITDYLAKLKGQTLSQPAPDSPVSPEADGKSLAEKVVDEMRSRVTEVTQLTASAGIAANTLLAKVCSDMNKPNGQFFLKPTRESIMEFVSKLPIRKIPGIGSVTEQHLAGLGIETCGDLWENRGKLKLLFYETSWDYFIRAALGIGSTGIYSGSERDRKSISCERTFRDCSDKAELTQICEHLCDELSEDMKSKGIVGKSLTLKFKVSTFEVKTKVKPLFEYTNESEVMFRVAKTILLSEVNFSKPLRLLGVRMSNLLSADEVPTVKVQKNIAESFSKQSTSKESQFECPVCGQNINYKGQWGIDAHVDLCLTDNSTDVACDNINSIDEVDEDISDPEVIGATGNSAMGDAWESSEGFDSETIAVGEVSAEPEVTIPLVDDHATAVEPRDNFNPEFQCPVCELKVQVSSLIGLNRHIDQCLKKGDSPSIKSPASANKSVKRKTSSRKSEGKNSKMRTIDSYF